MTRATTAAHVAERRRARNVVRSIIPSVPLMDQPSVNTAPAGRWSRMSSAHPHDRSLFADKWWLLLLPVSGMLGVLCLLGMPGCHIFLLCSDSSGLQSMGGVSDVLRMLHTVAVHNVLCMPCGEGVPGVLCMLRCVVHL